MLASVTLQAVGSDVDGRCLFMQEVEYASAASNRAPSTSADITLRRRPRQVPPLPRDLLHLRWSTCVSLHKMAAF
jgi:hypothetical protein